MLRGDIEHVPLASVLSLLELEKKTGILRLVSSGTARFYIARGNLLKVEIEGDLRARTSREVFEEVLDWASGQFDFLVAEVTCEDELRSSLTSILIDHARGTDEAERDEKLADEILAPKEEIPPPKLNEEVIDPDALDWDPSTPL
jgi:hypothetical protein